MKIFRRDNDQARVRCIYFTFTVLSLAFPSISSTSNPHLTTMEVLRARGFSTFATVLENTAASVWNYSGTVFAPSDSAFTSVASRLKIPPSSSSRPSVSFFLYHALPQPLRWQDLTSLPDGAFLPTLYHNRCLYLRRNGAGEVFLLAGKRAPLSRSAKIVLPDIYVDAGVVVHGVDSILDQSQASPCPPEQEMAVKNSLSLDRAIYGLRRNGYFIVAMALKMRKMDLTQLPGITVLALTDEDLLIGAFSYDVRYHVIPRRLTLQSLAALPDGITIDTLLPGKQIIVGSRDGAITLSGAKVGGAEVYQNGWFVAIQILEPLQISSDGLVQDSSDALTKGIAPTIGNSQPLPDIGRLPDEGAPSPAKTYLQRQAAAATPAAQNPPISSDGGTGGAIPLPPVGQDPAKPPSSPNDQDSVNPRRIGSSSISGIGVAPAPGAVGTGDGFVSYSSKIEATPATCSADPHSCLVNEQPPEFAVESDPAASGACHFAFSADADEGTCNLLSPSGLVDGGQIESPVASPVDATDVAPLLSLVLEDSHVGSR